MKKLLAGALLVASCSSSPAEPAKVVTTPVGVIFRIVRFLESAT